MVALSEVRVEGPPRGEAVWHRGDDAGRGKDASRSEHSARVADGAAGVHGVGVRKDGLHVRPAAEARRHGVARLALEPAGSRERRVRLWGGSGEARLLVNERVVEEPLDDPARHCGRLRLVDTLPSLEAAHAGERRPTDSIAEPVAQVEVVVADARQEPRLDHRLDSPPPRRREELRVHDARRRVPRA